MRTLVKVFVLATGLLLTGCQTLDNKYYGINDNHLAAQRLVDYIKKRLPTKDPLIAATFVDINDLTKSSALGRSIAQQFATVFTRNRYQVIEVLLRKNIYIQKQNGEFLLSRELVNISQDHHAQAVIVGTYAVGETRVYVTAKVVDADTSVVLSAYDYSIPIDKDTKALLLR
ncbi:MAG: FlgO family outer membrane protein [Methylococcales bacterium]|nr:FlgO family outer membrane protein [Methylococcales bacterium]